jgi:hypothetical protein
MERGDSLDADPQSVATLGLSPLLSSLIGQSPAELLPGPPEVDPFYQSPRSMRADLAGKMGMRVSVGAHTH